MCCYHFDSCRAVVHFMLCNGTGQRDHIKSYRQDRNLGCRLTGHSFCNSRFGSGAHSFEKKPEEAVYRRIVMEKIND